MGKKRQGRKNKKEQETAYVRRLLSELLRGEHAEKSIDTFWKNYKKYGQEVSFRGGTSGRTKGLGTEEIQDAVHRLSEQNKQAGELLVQLGEFLKEVISRTEEADLDAKKSLKTFP